MKYKVGILDSEYSFSKSLMEYINYNFSNYMYAVVFGNNSSLYEYLCCEDMDLLLVNENEAQGLGIGLPAVYMVDDRARCRDGCIFKYQSAYETAKSILRVLEKYRQTSRENRRFIGVFSPLGRCGKTELSLGLCNNSENSLYIGMENNTCVDRYIQSGITLEALKDISKSFMYYLATENPSIVGLFVGLPLLNGFRALTLMGGARDIGVISKENLLWFKELCLKDNLFSRVVFDVGVDVLSDNGILKIFDSIYFLQLSDGKSIGKLSLFAGENELLLWELGEKIKYYCVPDANFDSEEMQGFIEEYEL